MRYLCIHCDEKFELSGDAEQRCPKCLRVHGLRQLGADPEKAASPQRKRGPLLAMGLLGVVLVAGLAYAWQQKHGGFGAGQGAALGASKLEAELAKHGVQAEPLAKLLEPDDAIEDFAERAAGSASSASEQAAAVVTAIQARRSAQAIVAWSLSEPRTEPLMTAAETLAAISKNGARAQLYPLEAAALAVSALRTLDVPAQLAEVQALTGERAPLDPSGRFGYFVVALPAEAKDKPAQLFDPYGGRRSLAPKSAPALLSDVEAVGAALSLRASTRLANNEDPAAALRDADAAVKLLPSSAAVRTARGTVLLASAASELGSAELQAAAQLAPDPARRNNLAMLYLAMGDGDRAVREVSQALSEQPDFALAHLTLAAIQLARGERDQARAELEKADSLSPGLPGATLTWAQYHASSGNVAEAIAFAQRAVDARPKDPQSRLLLAGLYRQAARYDGMREQAQKVLALTPAPLQPRMRELISRLLGPTALQVDAAPEPSAAEPGVAAAPDPAELPDPDRLDLGGGGPSSGSRLRLLEDGAPSTGTLKGKDDAPTLRLKEPGSTGLTLPR